MRHYFILYICLLAFFFSCKRDNAPAPTTPPVAVKKVNIRLQLSGDVTAGIDQRRAPQISGRSYYDSTIFAVNIRTGIGYPYGQGVWDRGDSIVLALEPDSSYVITVAAIKRGSSLGLWYQLSPDKKYKFYPYPLGREIFNRMFYYSDVTPGHSDFDVANFIDSMKNMVVVTDVATNASETYPIAELDTYYGRTDFTLRDSAHNIVYLLLKRLSFGIQYNILHLSSGSLEATYGGQMAPYTMSAAGITPVKIYTADQFRYQDSIPGNELQVTLTWTKGDGSKVVLGTKPIRPKRNTLTTINVTADATPLRVFSTFNVSDTTWLGDSYFNF